MVEKYLTIYEDHQEEIVEKKSRFIATIRHVETEDDVKAVLDTFKKKYSDATHNVFAYTIGVKQPYERCSDDGEPSGTAGMPILERIRGHELNNVIIIVTRYFGGTLLGTGGLVRAYGGSAKEAITTANLAKNVLYYRMNVKVDYTLSGKVQYELLENAYTIHSTEYLDKVAYNVLVEYARKDAFIKQMMDITSGVGEIVDEGLCYGEHRDNGIIIRGI